MICGNVRADLTEIPTVMRTMFPKAVMVIGVVKGNAGHIMAPPFFPRGLRINTDADADAYVGTLQTIAVKPPWIESVANGGRLPCVFQQDSAPPNKALKTQDLMDGQEFSLSYKTKFTATPKITKS
ncbi:hypothetical protein ACTXT7_017471 [Hymenolepis weldensis]